MSSAKLHPSEAFRDADPALWPLVETLNTKLKEKPLDLAAIKAGLITLLEFLSSSVGRTNVNCRAVDGFFVHDHSWVDASCQIPIMMFSRIWTHFMTRSAQRISHRISIPAPSSSWRERVAYDI